MTGMDKLNPLENKVGARPSATGSREPDPQAVPALSGFDPAREGAASADLSRSVPRDFGNLEFALSSCFVGVQGSSEEPDQIRNFAAMLLVLADTFEKMRAPAIVDTHPKGDDAKQGVVS